MTKMLVVDDEPGIQKVLSTFFSQRGYAVRTASNGAEALRLIEEVRPHLVFLDVRMDGMSGVEVLRRIRETDPIMKVIMITAVKDDATVAQTRELGASDYVTKPFDLEYLQNEVVGKVHAQLYEELRQSYDRLQRVFRGVVEAFALVIGKTDPHYTGAHVGRTIRYGAKIVQRLRSRGISIGHVSEDLFLAGILLHDVGKIFTPKEILLKPGPLTDQEWVIMKRHPADGAAVVGQIEGLEEMAKIIRHHQEKYDGTGYPDGLRGEQIPLGSRIAAVVDAFDAMITDRPYRQGMSIDEALAELQRCAGSQFDPQIVEVLLELYRQGELKDLLRGHG